MVENRFFGFIAFLLGGVLLLFGFSFEFFLVFVGGAWLVIGLITLLSPKKKEEKGIIQLTVETNKVVKEVNKMHSDYKKRGKI